MLERIKQNIRDSGFHFYIVTGASVPRYAYTIGLRDKLGAELVLAGAIYYSGDDIKRVVRAIREQLTAGKAFDSVFPVDGLGLFTLRKAQETWSSALMLGAIDYYQTSDVKAYQIVPDQLHRTIDTPDMGKEWNATAAPAWQWLHDTWPYSVPRTSTATTNLDALRGNRITEATRWEQDEWELFAGAGPEVSDADARVVPLGCLLAADPSLAPVIDLEIGKGLWRDDSNGDWNPWDRRA